MRNTWKLMLGPVTAVALCAGLATASDGMRSESWQSLMPSAAIVESETFINGHPDLRWRHAGLDAMRKGDHGDAFVNFEQAARYADKPSQAMVAELYWIGHGTSRNRPLAYAWMDLAAERGNRLFLVRREYLWQQLSEAERNEAIAVGQGVYDRYGDAVAKPRQAKAMRRHQGSITGSRLGHVGNLRATSQIGDAGYMQSGIFPDMVTGELLFDRRFWQPDLYWKWQDEVLERLASEPRGLADNSRR
ncbi:sel1 repeat family protein [Pseudofulvimonas gallinarii]|uniref:Sel1 repeat-containing protein n=3 Tax=Pseudofulvimonas gallinarii TaxID=634155 RepID=A0A4R3LJN2_9GAMM|nr:sel1 repeat family protein [Pseudofulvimonas gallinarii]TCT00021.1 hypothetical protein EDC25_1048 [Pseudofulvimonas gallinarii]